MDKSNTKTKKDDKEEKKEEDKHVQELKQKASEFEDKYKRVLADYLNLEKRVAEERKELILKSNKDLLLRLLPVLDTLILASKHSKDDQTLKLSVKQFFDILKVEGVEKIETEGANFDPNSMECIETVEGEEGKVVEETRTGYRLYDQVLRPAQVKVGKGS